MKITIDKEIETHMICYVKMGDIRIGNHKVDGINRRIEKKWIPNNPSGKILYLECRVGFGDIKIEHI